jgi:DNA-binding transcriptional regulator YiaG
VEPVHGHFEQIAFLLSTTPDGILIYTLEIEVNRCDFDPKYPKNPRTFGERIRKKRMELNLTMKELAKKMGVSETTVRNWEIRGVRPYRRTEEKLKIMLELKEEVPVQCP